MATTRLLRSSKPLHFSLLSSSSSSSSSLDLHKRKFRCLSKAEGVVEKRVSGGEERRPSVAVKAVAAASQDTLVATKEENKEIDLGYLIGNISDAGLKLLRHAVKRRPWKLLAEMVIEKAIIDSRFFTLFAVAGSLLGSALCFLEGCFVIVESYLQYFRTMSQSSDQGHVVELIIEAIDMFLVGTAMLMFGVGLYVMFVGSKNIKGGSGLHRSNFFGLFYLESLPAWADMQSVSQAKTKIGHAVMMILQVGVLDKVKTVPMITGLDLACFAGTILLSSACIFLLSKLSLGGKEGV